MLFFLLMEEPMEQTIIIEENLMPQFRRSDKKTMTPMMSVRKPTKRALFRIFFSSSVNSDQGFCWIPKAISTAMPIAAPIGMPTMNPRTKSLILFTLILHCPQNI